MFPLELFTSVCSRGGAVGPHFSCMSCPLALARLWLLAPSGSLCGVLRGVESPVCVLGCLRRASPRGARTARFLYVLWSLGVAWFLWWCYFVAIVAVSLVGCPVAGARVFLTDGARVVFAYAFPCE